MYSLNRRDGTSKLTSFAILAALNPEAKDDLANQYLRGLKCEFCALGVPLQHGRHVIGSDPPLYIPCDADEPLARPKAKPVKFTGRGIRKVE
jgi:hypothetical protein